MNKPEIPEKFEEMQYCGEWTEGLFLPKNYDKVEFVCFDDSYEYWKARDNEWNKNLWYLFRNKIKKRCKECGHILEDEIRT